MSNTRNSLRSRQRSILGQVQDVEGSFWDVREIRDTKHGFDLLFGSPVSRLGSYRGGLPRLIATRSLTDYWEGTRTKRDGEIYDLPAGRTTLKRIRHRLGFHSLKDIEKFWLARIDDLRSLSAPECAALHNVGVFMVRSSRMNLLGKSTRDIGWWRAPHVLEVLRSNIALREMGEKLGISISQAHRLKRRARE